jgi:FO synthase
MKSILIKSRPEQIARVPDQAHTWALVPVKTLENAKQRLSSCLGADRAGFTLAMLEDVLIALGESHKVNRVAIVTADDQVAELARAHNVLLIDEGCPQGMNEAVRMGMEALHRLGASQVLVLPADIPLATGAEIDRLIKELESARAREDSQVIGIGPSTDNDGTNVLCLPTNHKFEFCYGQDSFQQHQRAALDSTLKPVALLSITLAKDIDHQQDFYDLIDWCWKNPAWQKTRTWAFLQKHPEALYKQAADLRDQGFGNIVTYSKKVFIPLTRLCRDVCHYCTFATTPKHIPAPYMSADEVISLAKKGQEMGCKEALFTLGEKPELRHKAARDALQEMGFVSTLEYVAHVAERVLKETGLLPHINAGCMTPEEIAMLKPVSASMGIMLENVSERLCEKGQVHYGSPDKDPAVRLQTLEDAGKAGVPFTTGILIGIGETEQERLDSLFAIKQLHEQYGHIQEIIIQNFVPKSDTKMAEVAPPGESEFLRCIAAARLIFGAEMSIQVPPNLNMGRLKPLVDAGINDWGGVSPLTPDHVNPESPWPHLDTLVEKTAEAGKLLQERLTVYPRYLFDSTKWLDVALKGPVFKLADSSGLAREDKWLSGLSTDIPPGFSVNTSASFFSKRGLTVSGNITTSLKKALSGNWQPEISEISGLFDARGNDFVAVCTAADQLRSDRCGDQVSYVVNRNINYTNICSYRCHFCAFAKGRKNTPASDKPYLKGPQDVAELALEAWNRGATEVCLQGGIHPSFTGQTYIDICSSVNSLVPDMHIHAFSPLEVMHGAGSLGISLSEFLSELKNSGLKTLPGTAAEILCDEVRAEICPDKLTTDEWLEVVETAHGLDLPTTATIMFGHVDRYHHWAEHLLRILELQRRSGGITEFVPLSFVAHEAPIYRRGQSRRGPTLRESILMHAVSRLVFDSHITNIQTSWVKMGMEGAKLCLQAGANDLGGTLMNESITRAAGAKHGQEMKPAILESAISSCGRNPYQRNTLYQQYRNLSVSHRIESPGIQAVS